MIGYPCAVPKRLHISMILGLAGAGCADDPICGKGFGRTAAGACVPVESGMADVSVQIGPVEAGTMDSIVAAVHLGDRWLDTAAPLSEQPVRYTWLVDGEPVDADAAALDGTEHFERGQRVQLQLTVLDGRADPVRSNLVEIGNTPPPAPSVQLRPRKPMGHLDDLRCSAKAEPDPDGDKLTIRLSWTVNGQAYIPAEDPALVPGHATRGGQEWACIATASDGWDEGAPGMATVVPESDFVGWESDIFPLADADYTLVGEFSLDFAGASLAPAGDVDGDGRMDLLIPAYFNDAGAEDGGTVYLVRSADLTEGPGEYELADMPYIFVGTDPGEEAGHSVSTAGDMDGDGLDDLLICGYRSDLPETDRGRVYLLYARKLGAPGVRELGTADVIFVGEEAGDRVGHSVSNAGDVDGDGSLDLLMGAYGHDAAGNDAGKTYVIPGHTITDGLRYLGDREWMFLGEAADDASGHAVRTAEDVDGDGLADFVVGARRVAVGADEGGAIYLVLGDSLGAIGSTISLGDADYRFHGEAPQGWVGYQAAGAGDVDKDGLSDIMAGAHMSDGESGRIYLMLGATIQGLSTPRYGLDGADVRYEGEDVINHAGRSIAIAGDVDADGRTDLIFGARHHNDGYGRSYLILGRSVSAGVHSLAEADYRFDGEAWLDEAGYTVASAGDIDDDGLDDLLIGARQENQAGESGPGKAYIVLAPGSGE